jgi:hypothetical protein
VRPFDDDPYGPPEDRRATVARETARLKMSPPESPEVTARREREAKAKLKRADQFWGIEPGDLIPDIYKRKRPQMSAGDPEGDMDVG